MPIPNYEKPQLTIADAVQVTTTSSNGRFRALVVGPQYRLNRFGQDTLPAGTAFSAAGQTIPLKYVDANGLTQTLPSTDVVDADSVALYGTGLEAELATFSSATTNKFYLSSPLTPYIISLGSGSVSGTGLDASFSGRPVQVGDIVYVNDGVSGVRRRLVTGLLGATTASSYGANLAKNDGHVANSAYNPSNFTQTSGNAVVIVSVPAGDTLVVSNYADFNALVVGSSFNGKYGEQFTLTCAVAGAPGTATFNISSASGLWSANGVVSSNSAGSYVINSAALAGVEATITAGSLSVGDSFTFQVYGSYAQLGNTALIASDAGQGFTGPRDTAYLITVTQGVAGGITGAKVRIADTAGVDVVQNITVTADIVFNVGSYGLRMKFAAAGLGVQDGLRAGDTYVIYAVASGVSSTVFNQVVLNGPIGDGTLFSSTTTALTVDFRLGYSGAIPASQWSLSGQTIVTEAELVIPVTGRTASLCQAVTGVGVLQPSYRSLVPALASADDVQVASDADIVANFGVIDMDNDVAYAAHWALLGSAEPAGSSRTVSVLATAGTAPADFAAVLTKVQSTDQIYAITLVSNDLAVAQVGKAHVTAMNAKNVKNYRKLYFSTDSPGAYPVLQTKPDGGTYTCTISTYAGANILVNAVDEVDFTTLGLQPGDEFILPIAGVTYLIASVVSATEILLQSGPANPVSPAVPYQLWRADTAKSQRDYVVARSQALLSPLVVNVWVENGTSLVGTSNTVIPARFVAAEIAGIRSSLASQQGMTQFELQSISAAPAMYLRYNDTTLNDIAAHGTWIVAQDYVNGSVYVRHQLTTQPNLGSLYYEDNAFIIIADLDFQTKDILQPYIGKRNAVPSVVSAIYIAVEAIHTAATAASDSTIGPLIVGFSGLVVSLDSVLKDRVIVKCTRTIGLPLNNIDAEYSDVVSV